MANNENLTPGNPETEFKKNELSGRGTVENSQKAGILSGKSRRNKRILTDRIRLALNISTTANLSTLKKAIAELMPNRHLQANRELLKIKLAQAKTLKECGIDVYNMITIAGSSLDDDKRIKAINSLWDREEGKATQKIETTGSELRKTIIVTKEELEEEEKEMLKEFD